MVAASPPCSGSTPSKKPGFNYIHACKLARGHDGDCICVGCTRPFTPIPALKK